MMMVSILRDIIVVILASYFYEAMINFVDA